MLTGDLAPNTTPPSGRNNVILAALQSPPSSSRDYTSRLRKTKLRAVRFRAVFVSLAIFRADGVVIVR